MLVQWRKIVKTLPLDYKKKPRRGYTVQN